MEKIAVITKEERAKLDKGEIVAVQVVGANSRFNVCKASNGDTYIAKQGITRVHIVQEDELTIIKGTPDYKLFVQSTKENPFAIYYHKSNLKEDDAHYKEYITRLNETKAKLNTTYEQARADYELRYQYGYCDKCLVYFDRATQSAKVLVNLTEKVKVIDL